MDAKKFYASFSDDITLPVWAAFSSFQIWSISQQMWAISYLSGNKGDELSNVGGEGLVRRR